MRITNFVDCMKKWEICQLIAGKTNCKILQSTVGKITKLYSRSQEKSQNSSVIAGKNCKILQSVAGKKPYILPVSYGKIQKFANWLQGKIAAFTNRLWEKIKLCQSFVGKK